jgi:hypothetical protein
MSPPTQRDTTILDAEPITELEAKLQEALRTSNMIIEAQKKIMGGMQAQTVLQSMYLEGVRGQLQGQEVKEAKKKRKTGKINMDGQAKVLTQDDIIEGVQEWQDGQDKAVADAATKKQAKEKYTAAMDIWKVREIDRKQRNGTLKSRWDKDVKAWNVERDDAKIGHRKPRWTKPKMPAMGKATRRPTLAYYTTENPSSDEEEEEEEEEDVQMSIDGDGDNDQ